jgi:YVTN family beta-propeller protein
MADLPSGAVTFLFTDIEGSTRLVKSLRDGYGDVLREHQRLLREVFAAHGGHEVDTQGDSFFVAFARARDGLLAAVEGQRALLAHSWPDGVQIKVRMGLHTGQAVVSGERYTGLAVNRAARIGAAGHGGQILISQATHTLVVDEEEELHVSFRDLGEQRLKDLDRPVRLFQADADGLPTEFPPLRHEAKPPVAPAPIPWWRRRPVLVAAVLAAAALVALAAVLATSDSGGGLTEVQPNHVGVVDPETNEIVAEIQVGLRPGPVAAGGGFVWVGNLDDQTLTKVDPGTRTHAGTIPLERRTPTGVAVGSGSVWVAHGVRGGVSRVDLEFNELSAPVEVGGTAFGSPNGTVTVDLGSVWVVFGDSTLARLDPGTGRVLESTRAGIQPAGIASGFGSIWVSNSGEATVYRYNPSTFVEGPIQTTAVGTRPTGIAIGAGAVWVTNTADDTVTRIDLRSGAAPHIPVGDGPTAVTVVGDAVWVVNTGSGTLSRIDPATNEVERTIEIGHAPAGIVLAAGLLWVTVRAP